MEQNKIITYLNFAKKSRKIIYGVDDILKSKYTQLIIFSENLAKSSKDKLKKFASLKNISEFEIDSKLFISLLQNDAIKAVGIAEENLAKAIIMNFTNIVSNGGNLE